MKLTGIRFSAVLALMIAHCAGMIDLVSLPVWVGTLISAYHLDPQQAGGLATVFLLGAVAASVSLARKAPQWNRRLATCSTFAASAVLFALMSQATDYYSMLVLHGLAGICVGIGLSLVHGTIGRSPFPHRLFAVVGVALGVFSVVFLGATPKVIAALGGPVLFQIYAAVMLAAALACGLGFPSLSVSEAAALHAEPQPAPQWGRAVRCCVAGISLMALVQAMVFSFLQQIGLERGFSLDTITAIFIVMGMINLLPAAIAGVLEHRLDAGKVIAFGPLVQLALALLITQGTALTAYGLGALLFAAAMIFTHTFAFGVLARLDPSGRVVMSTPAMLMCGSAIGPILGGTLLKTIGYSGLGICATLLGVLASLLFFLSHRSEQSKNLQPLERT
ncbi:MFS transporter [Pokkaliibacter plantistimulans]|uniref:MFS transporter n=1 Tax=Proteobacteria bacterium 228 TaxID=2083153 RepID=A0A2S5KUN9_9PROT|nr:MFS transporter [Pokkaliibacter plantistimulans]PPC77966.1 MFS transporter [Pokkaliibacter plantistimulans]